MTKPRNTMTYALHDGRKKVYIGTTDDLERRRREHEQEGKHFTRMERTSRRMTEERAQKKEAEQLKSFRHGHDGRNPRYKKDSKG